MTEMVEQYMYVEVLLAQETHAEIQEHQSPSIRPTYIDLASPDQNFRLAKHR